MTLSIDASASADVRLTLENSSLSLTLQNACHQTINRASDRCNLLQDRRAINTSVQRSLKRIYLAA
ncbi:hypothetical protein OKW35_006395 [Paraburkholderia sp. MM5477-R1]